MGAQFGVIGLGVMGENLALNLSRAGIEVAVWNLETEWTDRFVAEHAAAGFVGAHTLEELVAAIDRPRRILIMIKAGSPVDQTLAKLRPILDDGDIVVDGGNSHFRDTERRQTAMEGSGIRFVGCGISGGEEGAREGASLMPGGERSAWDPLRPILEAVAARSDLGPCVTWVGPGGSGHFVKMVHNGIEYADMQVLAEGYDLLRRVGGFEAPQIADLFAEWNGGPLESFLVEITADILRVVDTETGRPLVDLILDQAGQKGTGRWTVQMAIDLGIAVPTIGAAVDARILSSMKDERREASRVVAGPVDPVETGREGLVRDVHDAVLASRTVAFAQGFALISGASSELGWNVELMEIARIWTAGCIIRARLLRDAMRAFDEGGSERNLLLDAEIATGMASLQDPWRRTVNLAQQSGIPVPAMAASLSYYDAYRTESLPQNLTQAQRDYFGAHTYERIDRPDLGKIHTEWKKD